MLIKIIAFVMNNDISYIICQSLDGDFFMIFSFNSAFVYIFKPYTSVALNNDQY